MCSLGVFVAGVTDALTFRDCGSTGAQVTAVEIVPCDSEPCALRRGVNYVTRVTFTAQTSVDMRGFVSQGTVGSQPMTVPLPPNGLCTYVSPRCPIEAGKSYNYSYTGAVPQDFSPRMEHEAAWCSTFSCLETSKPGDSAGFQVSLTQNQIELLMSVFIETVLVVELFGRGRLSGSFIYSHPASLSTVGSRPMTVPLPPNGLCVYLLPRCPIEVGGNYVYRYTGARMEREAAWCSTFSCLETSKTGDSAGFQMSLSQNQIDLVRSTLGARHGNFLREYVSIYLTGITISLNCSARSSIASHLIDTGHVVTPNGSLHIIYRVPNRLPVSIQRRCLPTAEAVAMRLRNPVLCWQKRFVRTLSLLWSCGTNQPAKSLNSPLDCFTAFN
ncbi:Phosphatidylglycerol/phosphatidylinositol transfer protein [Clonorchis sinensis]|uniref:Phosphatidylglycerol/phosphatidylinositol transfer protein n=1 Tax=Clonorchis sinensis TaxID=79923 RepID=A0A8T1MDD0_CLOSI|nr:Phosphatidylglycerol/phosphatidylinositol transfer protein [Clonorchis sinensis]